MISDNYKHHSKLQETLIADFLGWTVISGSGCRPLYPGDVKSDSWLGECKTHIEPNHKICFYFNVWDKIDQEAISQFKEPVLFVDDGSKKLQNTYVMFKSPVLIESDISNIPDYSSKSSISFSLESFDKVLIFQRYEQLFMILNVMEFKQYIGLE